MDKEMYTLDEVAQMSAFSTKSLRNFMKKNLLSGEKINGKWYFTEEAMKLCKEMTDRINAMQTNITFNFHYDTKKGMGRYIILGPFKQVHQITDKVF